MASYPLDGYGYLLDLWFTELLAYVQGEDWRIAELFASPRYLWMG